MPRAQLMDKAMELVLKMASKAPDVVRLGRLSWMRANDLDYRRSIAVAVEDFCNAFATPEARAELEAFARRKGKLPVDAFAQALSGIKLD